MRSVVNDFLGVFRKKNLEQLFKKKHIWRDASDFVWLFLKRSQNTS